MHSYSMPSERLTKLWNYERYSPPVRKGGKYFFQKNNGLQNQPVLYVADSYKAEGRVLIDPNKWSEDGTIALSSYKPTDDARLLAYSRTTAGSDWQEHGYGCPLSYLTLNADSAAMSFYDLLANNQT